MPATVGSCESVIDPGDPLGDARTARHTLHRLPVDDLRDLGRIATRVRRHVGALSGEEERLLQRRHLVEQRLARAQFVGELARIDDRLAQLVAAEQAEVGVRVERALGHPAAAELVERHPHLVDQLHAVRLRPLTARHEHRRRMQRGDGTAPASPGRRRASPRSRRRAPRVRPPDRRCGACGDAAGSDSRIRSIAASARSGSVSHVGERVSHSFGPAAAVADGEVGERRRGTRRRPDRPSRSSSRAWRPS